MLESSADNSLNEHELAQYKQYIWQHGEDMPEIRNWQWQWQWQ